MMKSQNMMIQSLMTMVTEVDDHVKEKGLGWAFWGNSNTNVESTLQNVKTANLLVLQTRIMWRVL